MKVSETVTPKASHERRPTKKTTENGNNRKQVSNSRSVKVEKTLEVKDNLQCKTTLERKTKDSSRRSRRSDKPPEEELGKPLSPTSKKPCLPFTRRPSNPKPALIDLELSLVDPDKVCKKFPNSPTSDSSDTEKCKRKPTAKTKPNVKTNGQAHAISCNAPDTSKNAVTKRTKTVLKRQLALDNVPSNLKESFSVSEESLNSITSVTQLLKIERSPYAYNGSSNNSNSAYDDDEEEEEIVTGGVKLLAARWQARNDNSETHNINQNGILRKNKSSESVRSNKTSDDDCLNSKTKLFQAIQQSMLQKNAANNANYLEKQKVEMNKRQESKSKMSPLGRTSPSSPKPEKPQERRKNTVKKSQTKSKASEAASVLLNTASVAGTSAKWTDRKTARTKLTPNSSSSSPSSPPALSNKRTTGVVTTAKKLEELSVSTVKKETSTLNRSKARSRSTSPIKSNTVSASANKPAAASPTPSPPPPQQQATTTPLFSRGRSTNRRSTLVETTLYSKSLLAKPFSHDEQQPRRSRSVSSTPGLPSYAAATTTSLAKQTNQIRDHKEESTRTNRSTSYHKSHLINANSSGINTSASTTTTPALTGTSSDARHGQGQRRNVVALKKNRITDSHSTRKNESQQIASATTTTTATAPPLLKNASPRIKTSSVNSNSSSLSLSSSAPLSLPKSKSGARNKTANTTKHISHKDTLTKLEIGSTTKSDVRSSTSNKTDWKASSSIAGNRKREEANFSASSFSPTPSSSSPSAKKSGLATTTRLAKTKEKQRIIPSIIMSEYVDEDNKDGKTTVVAHTKSLFIPLQFIEPLEPTCDIEEGSCLELKVRVKGAEAVIWVKESKIIPNAPPDFQYFHEKSSDLYGLRIADVFLEDSGLYICEAYGAGGSEITCWCEIKVLESGAHEEYDDEDISWEDLNMSEEIASPQPLVVPVIVTSQAEQESEPSPPFETAMSKEPSPIRTVTVVKQVDSEEDEHPSTIRNSHKNRRSSQSCDDEDDDIDCDQHFAIKQSSSYQQQQHHLNKSSSNESAFPKSFAVAEQIRDEDDDEGVQGASRNGSSNNRVKSLSAMFSGKQVPSQVNYKKVNDGMTELASANITKETRFTYAKEEIKNDSVTDATSVSVIRPTKADHLATLSDANHPHHHHQNDSSSGKRKLTGELSSASDESIYLKEGRSGDEGAVSSAEENSASASLDAKSTITNDEEITAITSVDSPFPPVSSPCSEQNGRSSSVDSAIGFLGRPLFSDGKFPPRILVGPNNIIALYDEVVHLRVKVQNYGIPKTSVNWFKFVNGTYKRIELNSGDQSSSQGEAHISITKCGTSLNTLTITHINYDDCGRYRVKVQNLLGMDSHDCLLTVEGPPEAPGTPPKVKYDEKSKTILIQWSSCPYDGGSKITGYYVEASIVQGSKTSINRDDLDNWQLLTPQSYSWLCYTLTNPKRGSVYRFRVFGENSYGKGKPTEPSLPLLVPVLMEGRRAGSSDALLWSLKSLSPEETSLRTDSSRKLVRQPGNEVRSAESSTSVQEEEEPLEFKNVTVKRESFYNLYEKLDELGKGRFGIVFEVLHKETKKSYAGKFVKCIKAKDKERVQLEVKIMNDLGYHPKLICLIDAFEMPREIVIVTQQINGGELFERVVADDFTLTEGDCITFLRQICDAVRFIHAKNIMHLDLKPENILCTSKDSNLIKIIDFGLAQYYDAKEPIRVLFGTAEFVSPEIINYEPIAPSTDNWSIGVITYILLSGLSPFMGDNDNETFSNITRAEFDFEDEAFEKISDDAKDFISSLIVKRPEKRLTAEECLSHRWLKQESVECKKGIILPTDKLKRFLVRRKWQKTGNAIRALSRMTTLYSRRSSSASSTTPTGSMSISSPPPSSFRSGSLALQESADDNVFFSHSSTSPETNLNLNNKINHQEVSHVQVSETKTRSVITTKPVTHKPNFTDQSRSDSGVCDIGSFSSSLNYD